MSSGLYGDDTPEATRLPDSGPRPLFQGSGPLYASGDMAPDIPPVEPEIADPGPDEPESGRDWTGLRGIGSGLGQIAGTGLMSYGFWLLAPWIGFVCAGIGLILISVALSPSRDRVEYVEREPDAEAPLFSSGRVEGP